MPGAGWVIDPDRRLLEALCRPPYEIPALSASVRRVLCAIDDDRSGAQDIADAMASDPAVAARVLAIANSSVYNPLGQQCDQLRDAVSRLGLEELRGIVVATGAIDTFSSIEGPFSQTAFWKHCLVTGIAAGVVANRAGKLERVGRPGENPYFVAGLLHDIGILVLIWFQGVAYIDVLDEARQGKGRLIDCERRAFRVHHGDVGGALMRTWGLPDHLCHAVQHHHDPLRAQLAFRPWAQIAHLADWIASHEGHGVTLDGFPGRFDSASWFDLGLDPDQIPELIAEFHEATEHAEMLLHAVKS